MEVSELTQYLEDNKDAVKKAVLEKVVASLTAQVQWELPKLLQDDILAFYEAEIRPAVKQHLADNKGEIMQLVLASCVEASNAVGQAMAKKVIENMSTDWKARAVFKSMFD